MTSSPSVTAPPWTTSASTWPGTPSGRARSLLTQLRAHARRVQAARTAGRPAPPMAEALRETRDLVLGRQDTLGVQDLAHLIAQSASVRGGAQRDLPEIEAATQILWWPQASACIRTRLQDDPTGFTLGPALDALWAGAERSDPADAEPAAPRSALLDDPPLHAMVLAAGALLGAEDAGPWHTWMARMETAEATQLVTRLQSRVLARAVVRRMPMATTPAAVHAYGRLLLRLAPPIAQELVAHARIAAAPTACQPVWRAWADRLVGLGGAGTGLGLQLTEQLLDAGMTTRPQVEAHLRVCLATADQSSADQPSPDDPEDLGTPDRRRLPGQGPARTLLEAVADAPWAALLVGPALLDAVREQAWDVGQRASVLARLGRTLPPSGLGLLWPELDEVLGLPGRPQQEALLVPVLVQLGPAARALLPAQLAARLLSHPSRTVRQAALAALGGRRPEAPDPAPQREGGSGPPLRS